MGYRNHKGIALFMVLWAMVLLSVIAGEFCFSMRTEAKIAYNFLERTRAHYIATAGIHYAIPKLIRIDHEAFQTVMVTPAYKTGMTQWRVNVDIPPIPFDDGQFEIRIENDGGKVNINKADTTLLRAMLNRFDLDETEKSVIVDSIIDWRDMDDAHHLNGAENDYYLSLPRPYQCRNGDFESIQELRLVRGITDRIFFNGLDKMVTVGPVNDPDKIKKPKPVGSKKVVIPLLGQSEKKTFDYGKININAAPVDLLLALTGRNEVAVARILEFRKERDFLTAGDLLTVMDLTTYSAMAQFITFEKAPYYTIHSVGRVSGSPVRYGVSAMVEIAAKSEKGYRIIRWLDRRESTSDRGGEGVSS